MAPTPNRAHVDGSGTAAALGETAGDVTACEALKIDGKHPDAEGLFNGAFIRRALGRCDRFVLSSECFAMLGEGDSGFLVAATDEG